MAMKVSTKRTAVLCYGLNFWSRIPAVVQIFYCGGRENVQIDSSFIDKSCYWKKIEQPSKNFFVILIDLDERMNGWTFQGGFQEKFYSKKGFLNRFDF